eukprot:TRINITY_DN14322_c0_g1_i1.p1 TRINITY_DN14322_c0_g1~~TRINITY_DN14322_c0_g1_i1.p1  ORF type:complete len:548 (-),score=69.42 TRINITY_DN14322_c0_g1_i1:64-1707(-)
MRRNGALVGCALLRQTGRVSCGLRHSQRTLGRFYVNSTIKAPTNEELRDLADQHGYDIEDDLESWKTLLDSSFEGYKVLSTLPDYIPEAIRCKYKRVCGYEPDDVENPTHGWYIKSEIKGSDKGPLVGKTVALKDTICLAGVPMMNGSKTLEGYTPNIDATIVNRILDAGGRILGKAHNEDLCLSGGSHTNAQKPVQNPRAPGYSAGGSSSGSGALVAAGEVDIAIGGDQGGSVRIPASCCGVFGLKPTHGLVPYTGVFGIEHTIDHVGPLANNTKDCAKMLDAIAGPDGLDLTRQNRILSKPPRSYLDNIDDGIKGLRVGVVKQGFAGCDEDVVAYVTKGVDMLKSLGAVVEEVDLPWHDLAMPIWQSIALEGLAHQMVGDLPPYGTGFKEYYSTSLITAFSNGLAARGNQLSDTVKVSALQGEYMLQKYNGEFYAKSRNLSFRLKEEYDVKLAEYDVLVMPTLPMVAPPIPRTGSTHEERVEWIAKGFNMIKNTAPFNVTGHPAITVPIGGESDGRASGLQIVGKSFDESTVLRASQALENALLQ